MFFEIMKFEWRQQLRAPLLWMVILAFSALAFTLSSTDAVTLGGAAGNVLRNAPIVIVQLLSVFATLSILLVVAFIANAALRDFDQHTAEMLFTTPVGRGAYLGGRFLAGYLTLVVIIAFCALAIALGGSMPWLDAARIGPSSLRGYAWGFGVMVLPNLFFIATLLFLLAVTTRSLLAAYVGVIAYFVLQGIAGYLSRDVDNHFIAALLDPFGGRTLGIVTRYWSAEQSNHQLPALEGVLLFNRVLWLGVSAAMLAASFLLFRSDREGLRLPKRRPRPEPPMLRPARAGAEHPTPHPAAPGWRTSLAQLRAQWAFDTRGVLRGVAFLVLLALGLANTFGALALSGQIYGTPVLPVTHVVLDSATGGISLFLIIMIVFYAGELTWRERTQRVAEVSDAFPVADWVALGAKFGALAATILATLVVAMLFALGWQLAHGFTHVEPGLYLSTLALKTIPFLLMAAMALFWQALANNKFLGYLFNILWLVLSSIGFELLHWEHNLYNYGSAPGVPYSDMNGYGHFLAGALWYDAYWSACALILLIVAALFWPRGLGEGWRVRWREARARCSRPVALALAAAALAFVGLGAFIFWNTNVLNTWRNSTAQKMQRVNYEKQYAKLADLPQPRITAVSADVDIHPYTRRLDVRAHYTLVNRHAVPIDRLFVNWDGDLAPVTVEFPEHTVLERDDDLNVVIYKLAKPLAPGASMRFDFTLAYAPRGFSNTPDGQFLAHNGTFFSNARFPQFGFQPDYRLTDRNDRRKYGLPEDVVRMPKLGDEKARANTYISNDADWISFETTVSTAADQVALAPGSLVKTWDADGRRYFHYQMKEPMLNFFAYLSARYATKSVEHDGVKLSVYYAPQHAYNVERMLESAKDSLDYYNVHYTPYQFDELRILEFPGYSSFAQSFANTIPFSESIGFIADLSDPDKVDYVYDVTAHEVAHQWWAHRVIGANMQGSTMLSESLAQYSSLMVLKHKYGAAQMRKFLKYELDSYLTGRAGERLAEEPLAKVENQPYIHYRKGSLVFYALQDYVGESTLDGMLKQFLLDKGFQQPPYTTSAEFMAALDAALDPKWKPLLDDFFWKITLYDNRVTDATAKKLPDGRYEVTLKVHVAKVHVDGKGKETEAAADTPIDIGVFASSPGKGEDGKPLYLAKRVLPAGESTLTLQVEGKPAVAGIDPYNQLIDKVSTDNRRGITLQ